ADVEQVRIGIGSDPRIGYNFIYPGAGYGGSCFPKDVKALAQIARQHDYSPRLLDAVESVNDSQKHRLFALLQQHFDGELKGLTIAVWGLAFKPNTDDMREAASRTLLEELWTAGAIVRAFDPEAMDEARRIYGERADLILCEDAFDTLVDSSALVIVTEWKAFRSPDFKRIRASLREPVLFDGRNMFEPEMVESAGLAYYGIGRGRSVKRPA
ncbi:MAG: UDP binding domain-containing protein, partial [Dokdonella sp.]